MTFVLKDKHHHIRPFPSINTGLFKSISLTVLVYENDTNCHGVMLYGKPEILLLA